MKKLKKWQYISLVGGASVVAATAIAVPLAINANKPFSFKRIKEYSGGELRQMLKDDYQDISVKLQADTDVLKMIDDFKTIDSNDFKNEDLIISKINALNLNDKEKAFIYTNYLEKLDIQSDYDEYKQSEPEPLVSSPAPASVAGVAGNNPTARYYYSKLEVQTGLPGWDINWDKGDVDPISHKYFSRLLGETHNKGWVDDDANERYESQKVKVFFKDSTTGIEDYVALYFNQAKDTDLTNEDYTFVAIEPSETLNIHPDNTKVSGNNVGPMVPWLFDKPMNIMSMGNFEAFKSFGLHMDNAYMASFHEDDQGDDNEWGNYMLDVVNPDNTPAKGFDARDGLQSMKHFVRDFINYADTSLNADYLGKKNDNLLYVNTGKDSQGHDTWKYVETDGHRIALDNYTKKDEDYHTFADDVTVFHKSNQDIFKENFENVQKILSNNIKDEELLDIQRFMTSTGFVIPSSFISGLIFDGPVEEALRSKILNGVELDYIDFFKVIVKRAVKKEVNTTLKNVVSDLLKRSEKTVIKMAGEFVLSTAFEVLSNPNDFAKSWPERLMWNGFTTIMSASTSYIASTLIGLSSSVLISSLATPVGAILGTAISVILNCIKTGNGHTISENIGDHGLNDWDYQWENNETTMQMFETEWSENYTKGINWRVTDGWFSYPTLDIQTNGDANWTNVSGNSSFFGGNSFNYGNKVSFIERNHHA